MKKISNFKYNLGKMSSWERKKAIYLLQVADELGIKYNESYGELDVNPNSGYTYLWADNYRFVLYMPINCELTKNDVEVLYTCLYCGHEFEISLKNNTLYDINSWIDGLHDDDDYCENCR